MATIDYGVANGRIIARKSGATRTFLKSDPQGNVRKEYDNTQAVTATQTYWPFGEVRTTSGSPGKFGYLGAFGYYTDTSGRVYVRARHLEVRFARWLTVDPLWPSQPAYVYAASNPATNIDPSGMQFQLPFFDPTELFLPRILKGTCEAAGSIWGSIMIMIHGYGNCCGWDKRCNSLDAKAGGKARDCLDRACARHDECYGTWVIVFDPIKRAICDTIFCGEMKRCWSILCVPYRDRPQCRALRDLGPIICASVGQRFP